LENGGPQRLTASRIRFYEASGLISVVERGANNYREYTPDAVLLLEIITSAQNAGFSLQEIRPSDAAKVRCKSRFLAP